MDLPFLGKSVGGTYALLADEHVYTGTEQLVAYRPKAPGDRFSIVDGRKLVVAGDTAYVATGSRLKAIARKSYPAASRKLQSLQPRRTRQEQLIQEARQQRSELLQQITRLRNQAGATAELAEKIGRWTPGRQATTGSKKTAPTSTHQCAQARAALGSLDRWDVACPCDQSLILAGGVLVAGGDGQVDGFCGRLGPIALDRPGARRGQGSRHGRRTIFLSARTKARSIVSGRPVRSTVARHTPCAVRRLLRRGRTAHGVCPLRYGP